MNWLYPALALFAVLGVVKLVQWNRRRLVSDAWLADHDRRSWSKGFEGVCWQWPYRGN
jgi:hypothetical protein